MTEWDVGEASATERRDLARREIELFGPGHALNPEWLLDRNPAGKALVLVARAPDGRIAGTRSLLPWRVLTGGTEVRIAQSTRLWTDPDFRLRGVAMAIGREIRRRSSELEYPVAFAFPSDRAIPAFRKLGGALDMGLERRQLLLSARFFGAGIPRAIDRPLGWMRALRNRTQKTKHSWSIAEDAPALAGALWDKAATRDVVLGVRDAAFVSWRYNSASGHTYLAMRYPASGAARLLAFIFPAEDNRARILDVCGVAGPEETIAAMLALVEGLATRGAVLVEWCPPRHGNDPHIASRAGFFRRRQGVAIGMWMNRPPEALGALADLRNYRLTEGDSDYA